jgi:hypothetical protein
MAAAMAFDQFSQASQAWAVHGGAREPFINQAMALREKVAVSIPETHANHSCPILRQLLKFIDKVLD